VHDVAVTARCPRCGAPTIEYTWHPHGVLKAPTIRRECQGCDYSATRTDEPRRDDAEGPTTGARVLPDGATLCGAKTRESGEILR
jgi:hypothetical protein